MARIVGSLPQVLLLLFFLFAILVGVRSGRQRRRSHWIPFFVHFVAFWGLCASAHVYFSAWAAWKDADELAQDAFRKLDSARMSVRAGREIYYFDNGTGVPTAFRREGFEAPPVPEIMRLGVFLAILLSGPALLARRITVWRMGDRIKPGHCRKCGYDLTGNVSGVCPECGRKIRQEK